MSENNKIVRQQELPPAVLKATFTGNWGDVHDEHKLVFLRHLCETLEIPLVMNPFLFINMKGRVTLYAPASAYHMIANKSGISTAIIGTPFVDKDLMTYEVMVRATTKDGRSADNIAVVSLKGASGEDYANAKMKCVTKAQRRAIKSLVGLPIPDEDDLREQKGAEVLELDIVEIQQNKEEQKQKVVNHEKEKTLVQLQSIIDRTKEGGAPQGQQEQVKEISQEEQLEIKQWRDHISNIFLRAPTSPFRDNPKAAAQFTQNETGKALKDLNAAEMEDLELRFLKKYPEAQFIAQEELDKARPF